ncbi:MAG: SpoIIIAH-like family protein [Clostridia bacterium]|nr:SpoIIIAH-like family protein [Clostridia bacterium]
MKIIKRNQLIILVISLMLITAGYLNFTADNNTVATSYLTAELGDATLVSSNSVVENSIEAENTLVENNTVQSSISTEDKNVLEENDTVETAATYEADDTYFTTSKLERENMYSQMLETYQQIYNNTETSSDQKTSALNEIANINKTKNAIMIAENLISAKGFKNVVVFVNDNSVSVIVGEQELQQEQIAQIQNIVSRELNVDASIIHICTK